jgi:hypothetical protein
LFVDDNLLAYTRQLRVRRAVAGCCAVHRSYLWRAADHLGATCLVNDHHKDGALKTRRCWECLVRGAFVNGLLSWWTVRRFATTMNAPRARDTLAKRCARTGEIGFGYEVEGGFSSAFCRSSNISNAAFPRSIEGSSGLKRLQGRNLVALTLSSVS